MNNQDQKETSETLLRKPKVMERTGLPHSTIYYLIERKEFPAPVRLSARSVGWKLSEIDEWINTRRSITHGDES